MFRFRTWGSGKLLILFCLLTSVSYQMVQFQGFHATNLLHTSRDRATLSHHNHHSLAFFKQQQQQQRVSQRRRPTILQVQRMDRSNENYNNNNNNKHPYLSYRPRGTRRVPQKHKLQNLAAFRGQQKGAGYTPSGGSLPEDPNQLFPDPSTWTALDNHTCLHQSAEPVYAWQRQAPYAIILGAMKAGTQALTTYLWQHPNISKGSMETHFFNGQDFHSSTQGISQALNQKAYAAQFARKWRHSDLFVVPFSDTGVTFTANKISAHAHRYALDSTPYYLLASDRMPSRILCVAPWAKWIAILRDPVERAASHYRYLNEARERNAKPMVDWEPWVAHDRDLLRQAGVVQDWNVTNFDQFAGSEQELQAWKSYLRNPNSQQLLGRGLYAIQIGHYLDALRQAGRPASDLHVIQSENLRNNTPQVYDELLKFLRLPPHQLQDTSLQHRTCDRGQKMPDHVKRQLEDFFEPYNQRLYQLLGWDPVWSTSLSE